MQIEEYRIVSEEAQARMERFMEMDREANYVIPILRKENFLTYWIAVVCKEKYSNNGIQHDGN